MGSVTEIFSKAAHNSTSTCPKVLMSSFLLQDQHPEFFDPLYKMKYVIPNA
jgi:hypothetical protein